MVCYFLLAIFAVGLVYSQLTAPLFDFAPPYPGTTEVKVNDLAVIFPPNSPYAIKKPYYGCGGLNVGIQAYKAFATKDSLEQIHSYYSRIAQVHFLDEVEYRGTQGSSSRDFCYIPYNYESDPLKRRVGGELITGVLIYENSTKADYIKQNFSDVPTDSNVVLLLKGKRTIP
jgi:hypothetical protein